ncbi:MAG: hypothetical protein IJ291_07145 [Lachnospiraceae bacterium]|nr:hypothetical protein [Lachnospiraceae bacterium]
MSKSKATPCIFFAVSGLVLILPLIIYGGIGVLMKEWIHLVIAILLILFFLVGSILLFVLNGILNKKRKQKLAVRLKEEEEKLKLNIDEMNQIINDNKDVLFVIPEKYRYAHAVAFMLEYLQTLRADNFKEAINLYEEEMHRIRMEQGQQQIILIQNQQQRALNSINNYNKAMTVMSAVNTAANVSSAFSNHSINKKLL